MIGLLFLICSIALGLASAMLSVKQWFVDDHPLYGPREPRQKIVSAIGSVLADTILATACLMLFFNIFLVAFVLSRYSYLAVLNYRELAYE